ncbi:hypothetical protein BKP35_16380 [Anaerobacillus arseniciselenatis]|uniref:Uncharacterized protein n=1 Tax=Anaerobacillus arseniciselenatis TaxID=85682 RepID=A0A1S2LB14_9BACI|nr:hypothetical protein [Anaerobacillus arseniciselenatis]OIJ09430.1 hypothetical protein BKP35_16380 [Anaerobacillus arseniciselenatis]
MRATRSDKKKDIKPIVGIEIYECLCRLSYITNTPIKDVGENVIKEGLANINVIEYLSKHFKRDYWHGETLLRSLDKSHLFNSRSLKIEGNKKRVSLRFEQKSYEHLSDLAYTLDLTVSSATSLLLDAALKNSKIVHRYIETYINSNLDPNRKQQLKAVLKFMNKNNLYEEKITLGLLINMIVEDFMDSSLNIKSAINKFIDDLLSED